MLGTVQIVLVFFFCGIGLSIAGVWFALRFRTPGRSWPDIVDSDAGSRRRGQRRSLGMAVVALVSLATAAGLVLIDPLENPALFGGYWIVVLILVLWLCGLAVADVLHTMQVQRSWIRARTQAALEEYLQCCVPSEEPIDRVQD